MAKLKREKSRNKIYPTDTPCLDKGHVKFVDEKVPDLDKLISQNCHRDVVELYNLSRRVCGNIWHTISEDLKELKIPQEELFKTAITHKDFALFKEWQNVRERTAQHMSDNRGTYRRLMKEKGVDPVAFAAQFVKRDMLELNQEFDIRRLIKSWGLETPDASNHLHQCDLRKETRQEIVQEWEKSLKTHPGQSHLIVTYTNRDTHLLNEEARHLMRTQGVIAVEEYFHTVKRKTEDDFGRIVTHEQKKTFSKGERLVFTENNNSLGVKNGTLGTIEDIDSQKLKVRIDGEDRVVSFASKLYPYFDRGWAITIIKSQGSTADRVFKLATFEEDRNLAYVGMTRHRESLQVFGSKLDFWKEETFVDRLSQNREKLSSLDYLSQEDAQNHLKPPVRLMDALSSLGNRLESLGYTSRKGWENLCERFLGKTRSEDRILFSQNSLEESLRAKEMGINAAPIAEKREDQLAAILQPLESKNASSSSGLVADSASGREKPLPVSLSGDISAFVKEQAKVNISKKDISTPDVKDKTPYVFRTGNPSIFHDPYYSIEEIRRNLTPHAIETLCHSLLGTANQKASTQRHLRYGASGSLAISLSGSSLGLWKDHERDEGGDIFKLVMRERGDTFREALVWVAEALRVTPERASAGSYASSERETDDTWRLQKVDKLLTASRPLQGTLGERYLREHRGLQGVLSSDIRFVPSAWNSSAKQNYPALAALARNKDGTVKAIQLVFLDAATGNKADVNIKKQSYGMLKGAYVQVQKGEGAVFVAEGVETALSVKEAGVRGSIYAALGISNFRNVSLFLGDKNSPVVMCADQDKEGSPARQTVEKAVEFLKGEGFSVSVVRPQNVQEKEDFNDVLKREGVKGVQASFKEHLDPVNSLSEKDRSIFSKLEKSIMENKHFSEERKQKWIQFGFKDPEGTFRSWNNILVQQEIQEERMQERKQNMEKALAEIRKPTTIVEESQQLKEVIHSQEEIKVPDSTSLLSKVEIESQEMITKVCQILPERGL
jgi:hypothetical protein